MEFCIIFSLQYSISINTFVVDPPLDSLHNAVVHETQELVVPIRKEVQIDSIQQPAEKYKENFNILFKLTRMLEDIGNKK